MSDMSNAILPCDPASSRRCGVSGPHSDKSISDDSANLDALLCDPVNLGSTEDLSVVDARQAPEMVNTSGGSRRETAPALREHSVRTCSGETGSAVNKCLLSGLDHVTGDLNRKLAPIFKKPLPPRSGKRNLLDWTDSGSMLSEDCAPRKRAHSETSSGSETETVVAAKISTARRGKGRSSTVNKVRSNKADKNKNDLSTEEELIQMMAEREASGNLATSEPVEINVEPLTKHLSNEELKAIATKAQTSILDVAKKSGNVRLPAKRKIIQEAASSLSYVIDELAGRSETSDTKRILSDNKRLNQELEHTRAELNAYKRDLKSRNTVTARTKGTTRAAAKTVDLLDIEELKRTLIESVCEEIRRYNNESREEFRHSILESVGTLFNSRMAELEDRLPPRKMVRPPLAADRPANAVAPSGISALHNQMPPIRDPHRAPSITIKPRAITRSDPGNKEIFPSWVLSQKDPHPADIPNEEGETWVTVVKKKKKNKNPEYPEQVFPSESWKGKVSRPKLREPKTDAVILTLQTGAVEKGMTYQKVLQKVASSIPLNEIGLTNGVKIRPTVTGAKLIEVPKTEGPEKVQKLAQWLHNNFNDVATVVRPVKRTDIRVTGLHDYISSTILEQAVSREGQCDLKYVKSTEIRNGSRGIGSAIVRCPVEAAKKIIDSGRILVGMISAGVHTLEQRPLRCFRCMGIGHTKPMCKSVIIRETLCFRCGKPGHKAELCSAPPHCAVCSDAGVPFKHKMGGRNCLPPTLKKRKGTEHRLNTSTPRTAECHQAPEIIDQ